jgi:hypothetical protein
MAIQKLYPPEVLLVDILERNARPQLLVKYGHGSDRQPRLSILEKPFGVFGLQRGLQRQDDLVRPVFQDIFLLDQGVDRQTPNDLVDPARHEGRLTDGVAGCPVSYHEKPLVKMRRKEQKMGHAPWNQETEGDDAKKGDAYSRQAQSGC